ncbi:MAG: V-type ATP synthase subunit I, partial [Bacteroidales bacterium]|nr:V-type ATP synthase subunit I [Bacteroidales bacterium]
MNKYSFWVFHKEYDYFLQQLRKIGVVHVQEKGTLEDKELTTELKLLQRYTIAIKGLENRDAIESKAKEAEEALAEFEHET